MELPSAVAIFIQEVADVEDGAADDVGVDDESHKQDGHHHQITLVSRRGSRGERTQTLRQVGPRHLLNLVPGDCCFDLDTLVSTNSFFCNDLFSRCRAPLPLSSSLHRW